MTLSSFTLMCSHFSTSVILLFNLSKHPDLAILSHDHMAMGSFPLLYVLDLWTGKILRY